MEQYAIKTDSLVKKYGDLVAVNDLTLSIKEGEIFGFLGPNGAGKSTTIRMLCGILQPTSGNATVGGYDLLSEPEKIKKIIGYMSQHFGLYNDLTVEENLNFYCRLYVKNNGEAAEKVAWAIKHLGLESYRHTLASNLSGGWRQRLALSCSMVHHPKIIFLDEPTAGIDPISRRQLWDILYDMASRGVTLFVTTHYMDEADRCNTIGFIWQGKLVAHGSPEDVKTNIMDQDVLIIKTSPLHQAFSHLKEMPMVLDANIYGDQLHAIVNSAEDAIPIVVRVLTSKGFKVEDINSSKPTIEDVFIYLSGRRQDSEGG
jgi:ABC-2 type transport system ATP-binding protein